MSNCSVKPHNRPHSSAHQPLTQTRIPAGRRPGIVSYSITRSIRGTQIPIVRDEPPSSRFPRFPPLEVFRRRPPMRAAPSVSGRHPKTFTCVDGSELARAFFTFAGLSVRPCVRPISAAHEAAGHNALRGSGPGQKLAFDNAVALVGCPDRRIDRLCITCCSPFQPSHTPGWPT